MTSRAVQFSFDPLVASLQPVLLSIPGSGNTMTRLLLDGVLAPYKSGSVFHDGSLVNSLPGPSSVDG